MKKNASLSKLFVFASLSMLICSCGTKTETSVSSTTTFSSSSSVISSSSIGDPNSITFDSAYMMDKNAKSIYGASLEYSIGDEKKEVVFNRYNEYTRLITKSNEGEEDIFVKNDVNGALFYTHDESDKYNSFYVAYLSEETLYREFIINRYAGSTLKFASNEEVEYLGRDCFKYIGSKNDSSSLDGFIVVDKYTNFILSCAVNATRLGDGSYEDIPFSIKVNDLRLGDAVKTAICGDIDSIVASPLDSTTFESLGFSGSIETPNFAIANCTAHYKGNEMVDYSIKYSERVNSGNDTYINQFGTFTNCFYLLGFNKSLDENGNLISSSYDSLLKDYTVDYDASLEFISYADKNGKVYEFSSTCTVTGGLATLGMTLSLQN